MFLLPLAYRHIPPHYSTILPIHPIIKVFWAVGLSSPSLGFGSRAVACTPRCAAGYSCHPAQVGLWVLLLGFAYRAGPSERLLAWLHLGGLTARYKESTITCWWAVGYAATTYTTTPRAKK